MRLILGLVLIAVGAAGAVAADRLVLGSPDDPVRTSAVPETEPREGDPPLVWVEGRLEDVTDRSLVLREGEGPQIEVERFAGGATRVYRFRDGSWRQLNPAALIEPGQEACVEALLDEGAFLAVAVFLGTGCGPA
jgi:hypothetical protein